MDEVDLVDDEVGGGRSAATVDDARRRARRARGARLLRRWWPVPVLVVAAVVTGQLVGDARARADVERLRQTPGVLSATLTPPLQGRPWGESWTGGVAYQGARAEGGLVVGVAHPELDDGWVVVALDEATGTEVWRVPVGAPSDGPGGAGCVAPAEPARSLWCTLTSRADPESPGLAPSHLVHVDLVSRSVVAERELPPGTTATPVGDLLVETAQVGAELVATASPADGGAPVWSTALPDPFTGGDGSGPWVRRVGGHLWVAGGTRTWSLDPGSGAVEASGAALEVLRGDRLATVEGSSSTRLLGVAGDGTAAAAGQPVPVEVDDGSRPDLVLLHRAVGTLDEQLRAVDAETGEPVWERPVARSPASAVLVLDGVVVGSGPDGVWALDLATGAERWSTPASGPAPDARLLTDGVAVLRVERDTGSGDDVVAAYRLRDGAALWTTPLPVEVGYLQALGGTLVARSGTGTVVIG